jgi:glycosyltransferase involved in cell wall biosynthesis
MEWNAEGDCFSDLQRRIEHLEQRALAAERQCTVWSTMAWLALEPVRNDVLVSVVTPTFNRPRLLAQAIESVIAQRHQRWEMVVVDDGSSTARDVVARFADERIRVFDAPSGGPCAARNLALSDVRGQIVTYLDDDNCFDPGWLHAVVWAFDRHPTATAVYGARIIDDDQRVFGHGDGGKPWMQFSPFDRGQLEQHNFADIGVIAHRSDVVTRFDPTLLECGDWDFFLALTEHADAVELPVVALYYRSDGDDRLTGRQPTDAERVRQRWRDRRRDSDQTAG